MKQAKKVLLLALCAVLLVGATIAGTVAYLTSQATVTNTFTVGKVAITMDEAAVNEYGQKLNAEGGIADADDTLAARKTENTYKLVPGLQYTKDPTIHVDPSSEDCYLFVKITKSENFTLGEMTGWTQITGTNIWYYNTVAKANDNVVVFETVTYSDAVETTVEENITITAYAVQKETFADAQAAWNATFGKES